MRVGCKISILSFLVFFAFVVGFSIVPSFCFLSPIICLLPPFLLTVTPPHCPTIHGQIMFNIEKAHMILDELISNGEIVETNIARALAPVQMIDKLSKYAT